MNKINFHSEHCKANFKRVKNFTHVAYFALVMTSGPYNIAAGGCLVVGLIGWILLAEDI